MTLDRRVVVVLGGRGLLGRAFVDAIRDVGDLAISASRTTAGNDLDVEVDVTSPDSVAAMFKQVHDQHGRIHAVVNSTFPRNQAFGSSFFEVTHDNFCDNVNQHLGSAFTVCQKAAAYFREYGSGHIVNVSSVYGVMAPRFELYADTPMTKEVEYSVCKAGIIHLTEYLAKYLKGQNIRVNCISPGGILDDQPRPFLDKYNACCSSKGMLDAKDVAGALMFLLAEGNRFVNGQNIVVDDGFTL